MTPLVRLFRTTVFKLSLVYVVLTACVAAVLIAAISDQASRLLQHQINAALEKEIEELVAIYREYRIYGLYQAVSQRLTRPGANIYLVTNPQGVPLVGNIASIEPGVLDSATIRDTLYTRDEEGPVQAHEALVYVLVLEGNFRLLVGRDLEEQVRLRSIVGQAALATGIAVLVLGLGGGWLVAHRVARRIDRMSDTSRTIMAGDLTRRLPLSGSGDEFDRLAESVNAMLIRIEELMRGLKEVSDNIAHDLKTPLTRLRSRVETALRTATSSDGLRAALESTLEETEGLIRTFDALLMIARTESGTGVESFAAVDLKDVAQTVVDLYEVLAEEKGLKLVLAAPRSIKMPGNRELLGQALANLLDNAIKHIDAPQTDGSPAILVSLAQGPNGADLIVADRGPGIPAEERSRVLDRFVRLEESRSRPGAGLGLALVAAIVRMHRGQILLEDNAPGLRAILRFPAGLVEVTDGADARGGDQGTPLRGGQEARGIPVEGLARARGPGHAHGV